MALLAASEEQKEPFISEEVARKSTRIYRLTRG
jgi:hypothetical protein